jgi:hypothetical protein
MLILMITIIACLLIVSIWVMNRSSRGSSTYRDKLSKNMHMTFSEMGSTEPLPVLSDEVRECLRCRCLERASEFTITKSNLPRTVR